MLAETVAGPREHDRTISLPFSADARWCAVQCQPHRERAALLHLLNQDFQTFLPFRERTRRHARKIETVRVPYFPGYLFVRLDLTREPWRRINSTFGVVRLVMNGEFPAAAPIGVVEALMEACGQGSVLSPEPLLSVGDRVRVLLGPFADLLGELDQLSDSGRVRVLLDIMGGRTPVQLPRAYVVSAASSL